MGRRRETGGELKERLLRKVLPDDLSKDHDDEGRVQEDPHRPLDDGKDCKYPPGGDVAVTDGEVGDAAEVKRVKGAADEPVELRGRGRHEEPVREGPDGKNDPEEDEDQRHRLDYRREHFEQLLSRQRRRDRPGVVPERAHLELPHRRRG